MKKTGSPRNNINDASNINSIHEIKNNIKPLSFKEFSSRIYVPQRLLLSPWLPEAGLVLITAASGAGKTYFCLNVAVAIASGSVFLDYKAPEKKRVLYIDGEMKANNLQQRLIEIAKNYPTFDPEYLFIINPDEMPNFTVPKLCTAQGQAWIDGLIEEYKIDLVIADNISTLTTVPENDGHEWLMVQDWMIRVRTKGCSMLWVHHTGKGGEEQRGTSKRIDVLDTSILLTAVHKKIESIPLHFKIQYTKARNFYGKDVLPFEAYMTKDCSWLMKDTNLSTLESVVELSNLGHTQTEIAIELKVVKSTISRAYNKAVSLGLIVKKL